MCWIKCKLKNTFLFAKNISAVFYKLLHCVLIKHFAKDLHTQQELKTN